MLRIRTRFPRPPLPKQTRYTWQNVVFAQNFTVFNRYILLLPAEKSKRNLMVFSLPANAVILFPAAVRSPDEMPYAVGVGEQTSERAGTGQMRG